MDEYLHPRLLKHVITHPCSNFDDGFAKPQYKFKWVSIYMPSNYMALIVYTCPKDGNDLNYLC